MNSDLEHLLQVLPAESRAKARRSWANLPADIRNELELTYSAFAKLLQQKPSSLMDLFKLLQRTTGAAVVESSKIAIVGPINVGKSTLFNALVSERSQHVPTSPVPGTTRENHALKVGLFELVDTPGADNADVVGPAERAQAMEAVELSEFLLIVFDATRNVTSADKELYKELKGYQKPFLVLLNKIDLIGSAYKDAVVKAAARVLELPYESVHPVSALNHQGLDRVVLEITAVEPTLLGRVGTAIPELRRQLAWQAVRRAAIASALVALTPIPIVDLIPLTILQSTMVLTLARIYAQQLGPKRILELGSSFGMGWLARLLFQEVSKMGGPPGWVLSASIATSATLAIGFAAITWFETGQKASREEVEDYARKSQGSVTQWLSRLGRRSPGQRRVQEELEQQLGADLGKSAKASGSPAEDGPT